MKKYENEPVGYTLKVKYNIEYKNKIIKTLKSLEETRNYIKKLINDDKKYLSNINKILIIKTELDMYGKRKNTYYYNSYGDLLTNCITKN